MAVSIRTKLLLSQVLFFTLKNRCVHESNILSEFIAGLSLGNSPYEY